MHDDSDILALLKASDSDGLQLLIGRYEAYCQTVAFSVLGNEQDCEECLNSVWFQVWEHRDSLTGPAIKSYLGRATRNLAIDMKKTKTSKKRGGEYRKISLEVLGDDEPSLRTSPIYENLEAQETAEEIWKDLESLPQSSRDVVRLVANTDETLDAISKRIGLSAGATRTALCRARAKLREKRRKNPA